jgi:hypothetical protein
VWPIALIVSEDFVSPPGVEHGQVRAVLGNLL